MLKKSIHIVVVSREDKKYVQPLGAYHNWRTAEALVRKENTKEGKMTHYRIKVPIKDAT